MKVARSVSMPVSVVAPLAAALLLLAPACVIEDGSSSGGLGGGSSSGGTSGDAEVDDLFATLSKPTADVLGGVWATTSTNESGEADVRFRFAEGKLVAGVQCTYPSRGNARLVTGATTTLTTTDLASSAGQFRIGQTLVFRKTEGQLDCQGRFENLSYTFVIQGTTMILSATEAGTTATLTKVGD